MAKQKNIVYWTVMILVVIVFHINYGLEIIVPTNVTWLMDARHDWGTHYLGWAFYRDAPWAFPFGSMNNYCYPGGTNIGLTDSIVLPALLLKPFSGLLPDDFQYLGVFLLFCHLMVAHYAIKIFCLYNVKGVLVVLGAVFIAANPVLFYRGMHPSLCTHGFILASLYYYLKPATAATAGAINKAQVALALIISLISPYMWLMIIGFNVILPLKHWLYDKLITWRQGIIYPAAAVFGSLFLWYIVGVLNFDTTNLEVESSYGLYGFNLNSLHNSGGWSVFFPQRPWVSPHQYEGYLYLGVGLMLLAAMALAYLIVTRKAATIIKRKKYLFPLAILAMLLALFAITNKVTFDGQQLFEYPIPGLVAKVGGVFRASGRFMWVPYYLFFTFVLIVAFRNKLPEWIKVSAMIVVIVIQAYDLKHLYTFRDYGYGTYDTPLDEEKWNALLPHFDRMITYPPFNNHLLTQVDYQDLGYLAVKNKNSISQGYSARDNVQANRIYTDSLTRAIGIGDLAGNEIYITTPQHLNAFSAFIHQKAVQLDFLDGYYLLYCKKKGMEKGFKRDAATLKKLDSVQKAFAKTNFLRPIDKPLFKTDGVKFNIEDLFSNGNVIRVSGWAFLDGKSNNKGDSLFATLSTKDKTYIAGTAQVKRADITTAFKKENLEDSGFSATIFTTDLEKGDYTVGIAIKEANNNWTFVNLGDMGKIEKSQKPEKLESLPPRDNQMGNIDGLIQTGNEVNINGWSAFKDAHSDYNKIQVVFTGKVFTFAVPVKGVMRQDVTEAYKNKYRYDNSGFTITVNKADFPKGDYKIGFLIENTKTGRKSFMETDKKIAIK